MMEKADQLAQAFQALGANSQQARVMATQLLKRSQQLSQSRGISETQALAELLELVKRGREGESFRTPSGEEEDSDNK